MGEVWEATEQGIRSVAIKFVLEEQLSLDVYTTRFKAEIETIVQLSSEHVVRVHSWGAHEQYGLFMVMELLSGSNLATLLKERGPISPVKTAVDYVIQACHALDEAHRAKIIHRDLKPANLFLTRSSTIKVLDFGIARAAEDIREKMTRVGSFLGTFEYSSPEQLRDSSRVDARSDIWSLGVVLFELLSAKVPFEGADEHALVDAIKDQPPRPLLELRPGLAPGLVQAISRCLEKDPRKRFSEVALLAQALAPFGSLRSQGIAEELIARRDAGLAATDAPVNATLPPPSPAAVPSVAPQPIAPKTSQPVAFAEVAAPAGGADGFGRAQSDAGGSVSNDELPGLDGLFQAIVTRHRNDPQKSIVFMLGAGFSVPAVPDAERFVEAIEAEMPPDQLNEWRRIDKISSANRYKDAFKKLIQMRGQDTANAVVRRAILKRGINPARQQRVNGSSPSALERRLSDWNLPPAADHLGWIIADGLSRSNNAELLPGAGSGAFSRIHLTTNFDPLLSIAVRRHGGIPIPLAIAGDQPLPQPLPDSCLIAHLHGRWDYGDTLHVKLDAEREELRRNLEVLIKGSVVVVVGYGGWHDIFTHTLKEMSSADVDVLWGFYDQEPLRNTRQGELVRNLARHGERVSFFRGVIAADLFKKLRLWLATENETQRAKRDAALPALQDPEATRRDIEQAATNARQLALAEAEEHERELEKAHQLALAEAEEHERGLKKTHDDQLRRVRRHLQLALVTLVAFTAVFAVGALEWPHQDTLPSAPPTLDVVGCELAVSGLPLTPMIELAHDVRHSVGELCSAKPGAFAATHLEEKAPAPLDLFHTVQFRKLSNWQVVFSEHPAEVTFHVTAPGPFAKCPNFKHAEISFDNLSVAVEATGNECEFKGSLPPAAGVKELGFGVSPFNGVSCHGKFGPVVETKTEVGLGCQVVAPPTTESTTPKGTCQGLCEKQYDWCPCSKDEATQQACVREKKCAGYDKCLSKCH
jgi:serine/threonine-protein kinase